MDARASRHVRGVKYRDAVMPERQSDSLAFLAKSDAQTLNFGPEFQSGAQLGPGYGK
ncbi:hypothetical protein HY26_04905 [Hyphomonas sp. GM-8P]|nr:hypothetical protein HY26_04905 [Hyphomonas sp. GM-8P]